MTPISTSALLWSSIAGSVLQVMMVVGGHYKDDLKIRAFLVASLAVKAHAALARVHESRLGADDGAVLCEHETRGNGRTR